jgi:heme/copper-type cytochrome/quinol oxidase subunit 4
MRREKKNRNILPYVRFVIRILFTLFAMAVAVLLFLDLLEKAGDRFSYGLCFLVPVISAVVVFGDLYLRYKLDIRPLRKKAKGSG